MHYDLQHLVERAKALFLLYRKEIISALCTKHVQKNYQLPTAYQELAKNTTYLLQAHKKTAAYICFESSPKLTCYHQASIIGTTEKPSQEFKLMSGWDSQCTLETI